MESEGQVNLRVGILYPEAIQKADLSHAQKYFTYWFNDLNNESGDIFKKTSLIDLNNQIGL